MASATDSDIEKLGDLSLLDTLDHVLNKGVVVAGEVVISVADVELIFAGLNLVLGSVESLRQDIALGESRAVPADPSASPGMTRNQHRPPLDVALGDNPSLPSARHTTSEATKNQDVSA